MGGGEGGEREVETGEEKTCLQDSLVMFCDMSEYVCVGGGGGVEREKEAKLLAPLQNVRLV